MWLDRWCLQCRLLPDPNNSCAYDGAQRLARRDDPGYSEQLLLPSSSGPGRGPLKAETRVRFP